MSQNDYFRDFGDGSFRAVQFYVLDEEVKKTLYTTTTIVLWKDVHCVQGWPTPNPFIDELTPEGPKCILRWLDTELKILADFTQVAQAWAANRQQNRFLTIGAN